MAFNIKDGFDAPYFSANYTERASSLVAVKHQLSVYSRLTYN